MRFSTFLWLLVAMVMLVWVVAMALSNVELLESPFFLLGDRYLPLSVLLIVVFFAGFLPPFAALGIARFRRWNEERRRQQGDRTRAEIDLLFLDVLEAQLGGRVADTRAAFERILERRPDDVSTLLAFGAWRREAGDVAGALELHERARRLRPGSPAPHYEIARDRNAARDAAGAATALAEAVRLDPRGSVAAARLLRDAAVGRGAWEEALRWKQALDLRLSLHPDAARPGDSSVGTGIEFERALELAVAEKPKDALSALRSLLKREPKFVPAIVAMGRILADTGDENAALEIWRDGFRSTGAPVFLQALEDYHISREEPIRALEEIKALVARGERDVLPRFALGRLYYRLEMADEAYRELTALAPRVAKSPTLHFILGRINERRGRLREAAEQYRATIRELGGVRNDLVCSGCGAKFFGWRPRCEKCGAWGAISIDLEEQKSAPEEIPFAPAPVWGASDLDDTFPPV